LIRVINAFDVRNAAVSWTVLRHLFFVVLASLTVAWGSTSTAQTACDRQCLTDTLTRYLAAMVANDPASAPLAPTIRFTEDAAPLKVGEGIRKSEIKFRSYRLDFIDPSSRHSRSTGG
jgi:hypothetical protein